MSSTLHEHLVFVVRTLYQLIKHLDIARDNILNEKVRD
jgi:hypothetical protein